MSVDYERIRELIAAIAATDLTEVTLKSEDFELTARRTPLVVSEVTAAPTVAAGAPLVAPPAIAATVPIVAGSPTVAAPAPEAVETVAPPPPSRKEEKFLEVPSPMVGTFYRAPAPGEAPFAEVGDRIRLGQTVCIIEAMKLMNEIEAEAEGEIVEICVENAEPVEFGQVLMRLRPL
ncbi:MAG: acetyl-CoA carboxylase biotin carboxyl carrier protein [Cyanobacteria bacterium J06641_5]